jgi:hypothetical protein
MAGGGNYILDKGYPVLKTYNTSATTGVTRYRCVKLAVTGSQMRVDLNVAATVFSLGVVQEDIDAVKVAYGNAIANVALLGITKIFTAASGTMPALGDKVACGLAGGAIKAATGGTNFSIGIMVGQSVPGGTVGFGDLIDVLLMPTGIFVA